MKNGNDNQMIDLHTHTNISDGKLSPKDLINRASEYGLTAIAICDHDTVEAYSANIFAFAQKKNVRLIPGIEFSTTDEEVRGYHVVGLFIDYKNNNLLKEIEEIKKSRRIYTEKVVEVLKNEGFSINTNSLLLIKNTITKAHIARSVIHNKENEERLTKEFGHIPTEGEFIETYMLKGQKCFAERSMKITTERAIKIIHEAGGLAFLAHPASYIINGEKLENFGQRMRDLEMDGLETYNVQYNKSDGDVEVNLVEDLINYCEKFNLLQSGGSDFHTDDKSEIGNHIDLGFKNYPLKIPDNLIMKMEEKLNFR